MATETIDKAAAAPPADLLDELARASERLESAEPPEIIRWAAERFGDRLTMATAFGPEGCAIIHWLATVAPKTFVFNLETGYQFKETLELRDRLAKRYGIEVSLEAPDTTVEEYERLHGGPLYRTDSNRCCGDRKIAVIRRVLTRFDAWMSGIRRDQSPDRAAAPIVGWDRKFGEGLGPDRPGKHPLQPAARPRLCEHRLLALHPLDLGRRGRTGRPLERHGKDGVRPALARVGQALACHESRQAEARPTCDRLKPVLLATG
jgi:3'-phosphoadenosine 5'-phosphosulfate sulfotransferase (PAPS reductase)/FAD synthetase